jgi:hypothetical protein
MQDLLLLIWCHICLEMLILTKTILIQDVGLMKISVVMFWARKDTAVWYLSRLLVWRWRKYFSLKHWGLPTWPQSNSGNCIKTKITQKVHMFNCEACLNPLIPWVWSTFLVFYKFNFLKSTPHAFFWSLKGLVCICGASTACCSFWEVLWKRPLSSFLAVWTSSKPIYFILITLL